MFSVIYNWFWNIVAPPFCSWCREYILERYPLCNDCLLLIRPIVTETIEVGGYSVKIYALGAYQDPLKRLILQKNYHNHIGSHQLGVLLASRFNLPCDVIIPVPSHWSRTAWRGFNHIEIMATEIAHVWNIPCSSLLERYKKTAMQSTLVVSERAKNLTNSICFNQTESIENKNVLLIDDLMTTGSTVKECAKVLAKYKPKSISVLVACRAC
jgi:ComF family protein